MRPHPSPTIRPSQRYDTSCWQPRFSRQPMPPHSWPLTPASVDAGSTAQPSPHPARRPTQKLPQFQLRATRRRRRQQVHRGRNARHRHFQNRVAPHYVSSARENRLAVKDQGTVSRPDRFKKAFARYIICSPCGFRRDARQLAGPSRPEDNATAPPQAIDLDSAGSIQLPLTDGDPNSPSRTPRCLPTGAIWPDSLD